MRATCTVVKGMHLSPSKPIFSALYKITQNEKHVWPLFLFYFSLTSQLYWKTAHLSWGCTEFSLLKIWICLLSSCFIVMTPALDFRFGFKLSWDIKHRIHLVDCTCMSLFFTFFLLVEILYANSLAIVKDLFL